MNAKLLVVQGRPAGKSLLFPPGEYVFGRGAECHIRPNSDWVSRQHCLLQVGSEGRISVRDLGSRNGTLVNGIRVQLETALKNGDHLQVGPLVFEVSLDEGSGLRKMNAPPTHHETAAHNIDTSTHLPKLEDPGVTPVSPVESTRSHFLFPRPAPAT